MNVTQTNVDSVNAIIKVSITKADYQEKVEGALKNFRKNATVPGFRPGTVPAGMVKKMYGKSILAEEVNKLIGENLYKYIQDNNLNVLGEPLANVEQQQPIDFATEGDYDFFFDVALAPELKLDLSKKDKIDYFNIEVDEELVDKQVESYKANYGKYDVVTEGSKATDMLKGTVLELENGKTKEGGLSVEEAVLMASYMKDKEEQAKFIDIKAGDVITFNPGKAYEGNEVEIASFLHIEKDDVATIAAEFSFEVKEITRYKEADLDQELFDKVFGEGTVTTADDFRTKVRNTVAEQFAPDSDYKFLLDVKELLATKTTDVQFPDALLKRWLMATGKERTAESIEAEFPKIIEDLKFHLAKEQIAKDNDLKIEADDVKGIAMQAARAQFAQYGMMGLPDAMVENYANDMLKNQDNVRNLVDRAMENKIVESLKSTLGVNEKTIKLDKFRKFFEKEEAADNSEA